MFKEERKIGTKDVAQKALEAYNDVFSDIVNVLLFTGKRYIKEVELDDGNTESSYRTTTRIREQRRDIVKYWRKKGVQIALYGLENQTAVDGDMPLRVIGYDGAAYRAQIPTKKKKGKEKQQRH